MDRFGTPFDPFPHTHMDMSPRDFLAMSDERRRDIRSVDILPPRLGEGEFGRFRVEFNTPIYGVEQFEVAEA